MNPHAPNRKSTALKNLQGTLQPSRIPDVPVNPKPGIPAMPAHLTGEAKREWERITPQLHTMGLLWDIDVAALALYCDAWSQYVTATRRSRQAVMKDGTLNPYLKVKQQAATVLHKFLIEFGLTPASRTRIDAIPPAGADTNPFDEITAIAS